MLTSPHPKKMTFQQTRNCNGKKMPKHPKCFPVFENLIICNNLEKKKSMKKKEKLAFLENGFPTRLFPLLALWEFPELSARLCTHV